MQGGCQDSGGTKWVPVDSTAGTPGDCVSVNTAVEPFVVELFSDCVNCTTDTLDEYLKPARRPAHVLPFVFN